MCTDVSKEPTGFNIRAEECSFVTWVQCLPKHRYKCNEGSGDKFQETVVIINLYFLETFLLPTDAHNVKKHRVIKTF